MDFSVTKLHRREIATRQLKTAIWLFINEKDLSSAITLSSAASTILSQLVRNSGNETFIDYACRIHDALKGCTPNRNKYKHYIDKTLGVIVHKHMSSDCTKTCTLDLFRCAINSITMAMCDYITLYGQNDPEIRRFLRWTWINEDMHKIIELYNNMPQKLKKGKRKHNYIDLDKVKKKSTQQSIRKEKKTHKRVDLARNQIQTAFMLFMTGQDILSSITLAGAADVIFCELVNRERKKNFTDLLHEKGNKEQSRTEVGKEVNDLLRINALKHYDDGDEEYVQINLHECALTAISKAFANYNMLNSKDENLIDAFRYYIETNTDIQQYLCHSSRQR